MNLRFTVDPHVLLYYACSYGKKGKDSQEWTDLLNEMWDKHQQGYNLFMGWIVGAFISEKEYSQWFHEAFDDLEMLIDDVSHSSVFADRMESTDKYKEKIESEWILNHKRIIEILEGATRLKLPKDPVKVFIVDPSLSIGIQPLPNTIVWGHRDEWKYYSMVYLAHEYLHTFMPRSEVAHAVIELATDNELRIQLNNKGTYFDIPGHKSLSTQEKTIYPYWKKYLASSEETILEFVERMEQIVK